MFQAAALAAAVALAGCGEEDDGGVRPSNGGGMDDGTGDGMGDDGDDDGGGDKWDVGGGGTEGDGNGGDEQDDGCKKVDLLFVIDNSGSMADEQQNLVTSFPGFMEGVRTELEGTEGYNIGVVTSDAYMWNEAGCTMEGALVTKTGGTDASNALCTPFAMGDRFMTEYDDLTPRFSCAAQVGTDGDGNERPMQTMSAALSEAMNAPGACNEGFIRDDALLVLVVITDEEDDLETEEEACAFAPQTGSAGDPPDWFDTVVAAKSLESNVVVIALVGPDGADGNDICPELDKCGNGIDGAQINGRILEFARMFTHYFVCPVCAPDYSECFTEAVGIIESACDNFDPQG
jgi:hypothetical protein